MQQVRLQAISKQMTSLDQVQNQIEQKLKANDHDGAKKLVEEMRETLVKISDDIVQSDAEITESDKDELLDD